MKHTSVIAGAPCEFIDVKPLNPLISKCHIKVCYVSDKPNRNGSVITKEVATKMANSLPGSPIVGLYNEATEDFEEHSRSIEISGDKWEVKELTKPYGFVPTDAKCWFQDFIDDGDTIHKYLMTEGYLWTGQYPECQRVIDKGNNQSMELDPNSIDASWSESNNDEPSFFIINEAIISKLCILGEEMEPCFEGATIKGADYSLIKDNEEFKKQLFSMMQEIKDLLENTEEGGTEDLNGDIEIIDVTNPEAQVEETEVQTDFAENSGEQAEVTPSSEDSEGAGSEEDNIEEGQAADLEEGSEEVDEPEENSEDENLEEETSEIQYNLEEIPEYVALAKEYAELESRCAALEAELAPLKEFKLAAEKDQKQKMIDSFYMLTDADKEDVIKNIDTYSLDQIEAKLSVICVRNKVNLSLDSEDVKETPAINFNLDSTVAPESSDITPAWVKAVLETEKEMV